MSSIESMRAEMDDIRSVLSKTYKDNLRHEVGLRLKMVQIEAMIAIAEGLQPQVVNVQTELGFDSELLSAALREPIDEDRPAPGLHQE